MKVELAQVNITELRDGIFYADLVFSNGAEVSARPSDSIALALRTGTPIFGHEEILGEAGVIDPRRQEKRTRSRSSGSSSTRSPRRTSAGADLDQVTWVRSRSATRRAVVDPVPLRAYGANRAGTAGGGRGGNLVTEAMTMRAGTPALRAGLLFDDEIAPRSEDVGYRGPTACSAAGITYRQLDYWARTGLVEPSVRPAQGRARSGCTASATSSS